MKKPLFTFKKSESAALLLKKNWPFLALVAFLFLVAVVVLPIGIVYALSYLVILGIVIMALGLGALVFYILYFLSKYGASADASLTSMKEQLDGLSEGNLKIVSDRHLSPSLDALQDSLNKAIGSFSSYSIVYKKNAEDDIYNLRKQSGYVFTLSEFKEGLTKAIQSSLTYRSALVAIELQGEGNLSEEVMATLHQEILEYFPHALTGRYDQKRFLVYVEAVGSCLVLKSLLTRLVTSFHDLHLGTSDQVESFAYCRAAAVIYPYTPITSLLDSVLALLEKSESVLVQDSLAEVTYPHSLVTESNKRIIYFALATSYEERLRRAPNRAARVALLAEMARWIASLTSFASAGLYAYNASEHGYEKVFEENRLENFEGFARYGEKLKAEMLDPYFEAAERELPFGGSDASELPSALRGPLVNMGVSSFSFRAIALEGHKIGLSYFLSQDELGELSLLDEELLSRYENLLGRLLSSDALALEEEKKASLLESLSTRSGKYLYTIDRKSHRLSYLSANLQRAFPKAHPGDLCYEALRGEHAVCAHCPFLKGVDKHILEQLSSTECALSVLEFNGAKEGEGTILIEETGRSSLSDNRFIDPALYVKNKQALSLELSHECKVGAQGYLLSVRLLNWEDLQKKAPGADMTALMLAVTKAVTDSGYGDLLYHLDDYDIAFLLKSYTQTQIINFVEEISEILKGPLEFQYIPLNPQYAYSAIAYPFDASLPREILDLVETELRRSASLSAGYMVQVGDTHPRKALREDYILDWLDRSLAKGKMEARLAPIFAKSSGHPCYAELHGALFGERDEEISRKEFLPIAERANLLSKMTLALLLEAGTLYQSYGDSYFKTARLQGFVLSLSEQSLLDSSFPEAFRKAYQESKLPKGYVHLLVSAASFKKIQGDLRRVMVALNDLGLTFELDGMPLEGLTFEELANCSIKVARLESGLIGQAVVAPSGYAALSRFVYSAVRSGVVLVATGLASEEEKEMALHLSLPYYQGDYVGAFVLEKDFVESLAYAK
jgi:EAL domain-containing protein (putative c-di-GMP-specific phosphodiesterase class I)